MPLSALVDRTRKEREHGMTINTNISCIRLADGRVVALFDTPGCAKLAKPAVQMLSQADAAVLAIDATLFTSAGWASSNKTEQYAGWRKRVAGFAAAFHTFSVKQIVLCVTKMDLVGWRQEVFDIACAETRAVLDSVSSRLDVCALPLSACADAL